MGIKLPFGKSKPDWKPIAAEAVKQLRNGADTAEDLASRVKDLYDKDYAGMDDARGAYDIARHAYNDLSTPIRTILILNKDAPTTGLDLTDAKTKLNDFQKVANAAIAAKKLPKPPRGWAGAIPSLGDIAKVFDSIMTAIEWFKSRNDKERHELADILEMYEVRTWQEAGTPRKSPGTKSTSTTTAKKAAKKTTGG